MYDLDGVITRKDTFTALVVGQLMRSPLRLLRALPVLVNMLRGKKPEASRRIAEIALAGMTDTDYTALATQLGRKIAADTKWMRFSAVQRIRHQHESGAPIIIATATERRLAEALLRGRRRPLRSSLRVAPQHHHFRLNGQRSPSRSAQEGGPDRARCSNRERSIRYRFHDGPTHSRGRIPRRAHRGLGTHPAPVQRVKGETRSRKLTPA